MPLVREIALDGMGQMLNFLNALKLLEKILDKELEIQHDKVLEKKLNMINQNME